jgi:predicted ester cyclase
LPHPRKLSSKGERSTASCGLTFPDMKITIEDQIAEGDKVVTRSRSRGTYQGELWGIPPTGKEVEVTSISMDRIEGGKIAEHWTHADQLGMMQQLGVMEQQPG